MSSHRTIMFEQMKKEAIPATSDTRSATVVRTITPAQRMELGLTIEPILRQNERERIAGEEAAAGILVG